MSYRYNRLSAPTAGRSPRRGAPLAALGLAVLLSSSARPAAAASPAPAPFQIMLKGPLSNFPVVVIPVQPPIESITENAKGQADLLGSFQWVGHFLGHITVGGTPGALTDGIGAMTGAHGDALFFTFSGSARSTSPGVNEGDVLFTITGGNGRFLGATGSGTWTDVVDINKGTLTRTIQGAMLMPG